MIYDLPPDQFWLYYQYHLTRPIDGTREDLRHGILCNLLAACHGNKIDVTDFIPKWADSAEHDVEQDFEALKVYLTMKAGQETK